MKAGADIMIVAKCKELRLSEIDGNDAGLNHRWWGGSGAEAA